MQTYIRNRNMQMQRRRNTHVTPGQLAQRLSAILAWVDPDFSWPYSATAEDDVTRAENTLRRWRNRS